MIQQSKHEVSQSFEVQETQQHGGDDSQWQQVVNESWCYSHACLYY